MTILTFAFIPALFDDFPIAASNLPRVNNQSIVHASPPLSRCRNWPDLILSLISLPFIYSGLSKRRCQSHTSVRDHADCLLVGTVQSEEVLFAFFHLGTELEARCNDRTMARHLLTSTWNTSPSRHRGRPLTTNARRSRYCKRDHTWVSDIKCNGESPITVIVLQGYGRTAQAPTVFVTWTTKRIIQEVRNILISGDVGKMCCDVVVLPPSFVALLMCYWRRPHLANKGFVVVSAKLRFKNKLSWSLLLSRYQLKIHQIHRRSTWDECRETGNPCGLCQCFKHIGHV